MRIVFYLLVASLLLGCAAWTPEQKQTVLAALDDMLQTGAITQTQFAALKEAFESISAGFDWGALASYLGTAAASVLFALTGIRIQRGPAKPLTPGDAEILASLIATAKKP
jgi:hypothetical protein